MSGLIVVKLYAIRNPRTVSGIETPDCDEAPFLWLDHSGRYLNNHAQSGGRYKNDFVYPEQSFWFVQV